MDLQKAILKQYMHLNGQPTLKIISADTGIQLSRIFRIINGSRMKLSEYQIFCNKVKDGLGLTDSLEQVARECSQSLSAEAVRELEIYLKRKLATWKLLQISREAYTTTLTA